MLEEHKATKEASNPRRGQERKPSGKAGSLRYVKAGSAGLRKREGADLIRT